MALGRQSTVQQNARRRPTTTSTTGRTIRYPDPNKPVVGAYVSPTLARAQQFQQRFPDTPFTYEAMTGVEKEDLLNFNAAMFGTPATPSSGGSSGGGRSYGGGGGGGGGSALTQAMIDMMARALGSQMPQLQLQQTQLPAFQGQALGAFNAAPYTTALGQIDQAVAADRANIDANQAATTASLNANYSNPFANVAVAQAPVQQPVGTGLMATAGGTANPAAANDVNAGAAADQAGFQNLLAVLAAANQQSQNSRLAQVGMDANYGRQRLDASALGMRGGVNASQATAQNAWQQAAAERDYQNSLLAQQWQREAMMRNQDLANQQATANYQTNVQMQQSRLQPILDLIAGSGGANLDFTSLLAALGV